MLRRFHFCFAIRSDVSSFSPCEMKAQGGKVQTFDSKETRCVLHVNVLRYMFAPIAKFHTSRTIVGICYKGVEYRELCDEWQMEEFISYGFLAAILVLITGICSDVP
jgi:hypothetical protein